ncbi:MAG TPA: tRNA (adenosine(37)-N6)-threonylcarbamoyltransferase complex ATPase subunit type 1 TsaE [Caulobacteraceae bacterium]|nr:tRNA (adenosine(37)-N6)-threonylcarbamoyltransferase complex ATPase subunit type 1 TsaE [Caulobacteraceae bacterium]
MVGVGSDMITPADGHFRLDSEAATGRLGAAIGKVLERGEAVCLFGPLGAGKSVLARGLIRVLCPGEQEAPSPTFTLVQFYEGPLRLAHFDLFRLERPEEAFEIGLEEALEHGAAIIEWADRLGHRLPSERLEVELAFEGEARLAMLTPAGAWEGRPIEV